jgi:hypothetical protein
MITFKQFVESTWDSRGYRENPVPMGEYNEDNVSGPVRQIEKQLENGKRSRAVRINVPEMVKNGTLKATQERLHKFGGGDPVFEDLKHPVLFKDNKGVHHIIDGHHRIARDLERSHDRTLVHIFKV